MKKNQIYKGFKVLDIVPVEDCSSTGILLRHEKTKLEVFHLLNNDEENLFAFTFRTPPLDSSGIAHVIEHSVLCGSKKYPLKDPFISLENQSVNTYLNAYTLTDHTVYPASSIIKADYFNLMSVYADAVFFPLLKPEIFMQEAVRLEVDENKQPSIQGVVYNEMKGNYSSFENVASSFAEKTVLAGTHYVYDHGGDPLVIPELTLAKVKAFHKKHYCPANCKIFLYGNIPTEEQLDFLSENLLCHFTQAGKVVSWPKETKVAISPRCDGLGPLTGDGGKSSALVYWKIECQKNKRPLELTEILFLTNLLWGDDSAPVAKKLLDSGLGQDLAPQAGCRLSSIYPLTGVGLRGCEKKNAEKIRKVIFETLTDICNNGISDDDLAATCMAFEFSIRENVRLSGPHSLSILNRCMQGWDYDCKPWETLDFSKNFSYIKNKIKGDKDYLPYLIRRYLLSNKSTSLITVTPSASWSKKRDALEKETIRNLLSKTDIACVEKKVSKMIAFQNKEESDEERALIPHLNIKDLSAKIEKISTKKEEICGLNLFVNKENTNGIVYFNLAFPADTLKAEDYSCLSSLCTSVTQVGLKDESWDSFMHRVQCATGSFSVYPRTGVAAKNLPKEVLDLSYVGRDWLVFQFKALEEKTEEAFSILADCLNKTDFSDTVRLQDLLNSRANSLSTSLVPYGHIYASSRAGGFTNRVCAVREIWDGITDIENAKKMASQNIEESAKLLRRVFSDLKKGGAVINIIGTAAGIKICKNILPKFIKEADIRPLKGRRKNSDKDFYSLINLSGQAEKQNPEFIQIGGSVGFNAYSFPSTLYDSKESLADRVFCHILSTSSLWKTVRMAGGAYGVYLFPSADSGITKFLTYRDPHPFESLKALGSCIEEAINRGFSKEETEKAIIGCYSDEVTPKSPSGRGSTGFLRCLYGMDEKQKVKRIKTLLSITSKDLMQAALRYKENIAKGRNVILFGDSANLVKAAENTGKIINIKI